MRSCYFSFKAQLFEVRTKACKRRCRCVLKTVLLYCSHNLISSKIATPNTNNDDKIKYETKVNLGYINFLFSFCPLSIKSNSIIHPKV